MIITLKRFKLNGGDQSKINTFISFPLWDLTFDEAQTLHDATPEKTKVPGFDDEYQQTGHQYEGSDVKYDLYAVINHYGWLHQGHYVAIIKNEDSKKWYLYNDAKSEEVDET